MSYHLLISAMSYIMITAQHRLGVSNGIADGKSNLERYAATNKNGKRRFNQASNT